MSLRKQALTGNVKDADLRLLRIFKVVVECRGFSAAEVELNISRAAISMAISDLELRLRQKLCQRGRGGFSLTQSGLEVYKAIIDLMKALESFRSRVNCLQKMLIGDFNIGITDNLVTMPKMVITNSLSALKLKGPEVKINIRMIPPNEIEVAVLNESLHIGVIPVFKKITGLNYMPLYEERSQLYCAEGHPLFQKKKISRISLNEHEVVAPVNIQSSQIMKHYCGLKIGATATDREGIAFLILSGCYIGYLPEHYAERWVQKGKLSPVDLGNYIFKTYYFTIFRKAAISNLIIETFLQELAYFNK